MANNILNGLTKSQKAMIARFIKKGWVFTDSYWEDHHTGNPNFDVDFKSPNMEKAASIYGREWGEVNEAYLLDREAGHVASDWANNVFHYTSVITHPISEALKEHFTNRKNTDFLKLYSTSAEFDVKISKKIKDNRPTKVKVTIEIL